MDVRIDGGVYLEVSAMHRCSIFAEEQNGVFELKHLAFGRRNETEEKILNLEFYLPTDRTGIRRSGQRSLPRDIGRLIAARIDPGRSPPFCARDLALGVFDSV